MCFASNNLFLTKTQQAFLNALIYYSHFKKYHFFYQDLKEKKAFEELYQDYFTALNRWKDIRLYPISWLPEITQKIDYTIFFTADLNLAQCIDFRNTLKKPFPILGELSSLKSLNYLENIYNLFLIKPRLYDGIICKNENHRKILNNVLKSTYKKFQKSKINVFTPKIKPYILPFTIDEALVEKFPKKFARQKLKLKPDSFIVLLSQDFSPNFVCDLIPIIEEFSKAFSKNSLNNLQLLFSGEDKFSNYSDQINLLITAQKLSDHIKIIKNPDTTTKNYLFSGCDMLFSATDNIYKSDYSEILEAMFRSLPIVTAGLKDIKFLSPTLFCENIKLNNLNSIVSYPNLDSTSHLGFIFSQNFKIDTARCLKNILYLYNNPKVALKFGQANHQFYKKHYQWHNTIPAFEKLCLKLKNASLEKKNSREEVLFNIDYEKITQNLVSSSPIFSSQSIKITQKGKSILDDNEILLMYEEIKDILDEEIIFSILKQLDKRAKISLSTLTQKLQVKFNSSESLLKFNIAWMLKNGIISYS